MTNYFDYNNKLRYTEKWVILKKMSIFVRAAQLLSGKSGEKQRKNRETYRNQEDK